jgi:hypothetical protein
MSKVIASSIVVALVVASSSFATLVQDQISQIGLGNAIDLLHGDQAASSLQNLVVSNSQGTTGTCSSSVEQNLLSSLGQSANAVGSCALVGVIQDLDIAGVQSQEVGDGCDPKAQVQSLGLGASQTLAKSDGAGSGDALHTIVLNAGQTANNAAGSLTESQTILGMQTSTINGAAGATGVVSSVMNVTTAQTQAAL